MWWVTEMHLNEDHNNNKKKMVRVLLLIVWLIIYSVKLHKAIIQGNKAIWTEKLHASCTSVLITLSGLSITVNHSFVVSTLIFTYAWICEFCFQNYVNYGYTNNHKMAHDTKSDHFSSWFFIVNSIKYDLQETWHLA